MIRTYELDMCRGPLLHRILTFSIPLVLSGILQLLFNAADIVVVGRFSGSNALAAVGAASALINLLVNLFIGFAAGVNVMVARYIGIKNEKAVQETVQTAIAMAGIAGLILTIIGFVLAKPLLEILGTPAEVIDLSVNYMRTYFMGMVGMLVYNFGSAVLRGIGDTRRPLYILVIAGIINVILNLFFVVILHLDVVGVGLATAISQFLAAGLIVYCLCSARGWYRLVLDKCCIRTNRMREIASVGIPAGLQGAIFSLSNMLIQSSVNTFGTVAIAGNTAAANLEGFVYTSMNALHQTALSFISQNYGAGKFERIKRIKRICLLIVLAMGGVSGGLFFIFGKELLEIYISDEQAIAFGMIRMSLVCAFEAFSGIMDVMSGCLRGIGYSIQATAITLVGVCGFRAFWIFTIFDASPKPEVLFISFPISWGLSFLVQWIYFGTKNSKRH